MCVRKILIINKEEEEEKRERERERMNSSMMGMYCL